MISWIAGVMGCASVSPIGPYPDLDGDGFDAFSDCNDASAQVFPGAEERCGDGLDNDCDGEVDDVGLGAVAWFRDSDGDGFGQLEDTTLACDGAFDSGWSREPGDCDDTDSATFPGAPEMCDGTDQDCDGVVDNEVVFEDYYPDDDQDGYGDNSVPAVNSCSAIPGRVANARDCNDSDASISPDGVELCDGIDNDCDGPIDEEGAASIATTLYANVVDSIQAANQLTEARIDVCRGTHLLPDSTTVVTSDVTMIGGGVDVTTLQYMTDDARLEVHGELTVDGIAFRGTTSLGTAVVVEPDGDAVIRDSSFDDLSVAVLAEGTPLSGARVELDGVVITNCVGGIGARGNTNVEVSDTEVRDTPLVGFGSALFAESNPDGRPSVLLRDSLFEDNEGFYAGGITALGSDEGGFVDVQIERTTFRRNEGAAGAIWLDKANLAAVDSVVEFNEGAVVGGVRVSDGELAGLHIRDNEGTLGGGAGLTRARVVDCTIERNAAERGGGVHVGGGGMSSTDASTTIHGNVATVAGGGVYIDNAGFRSDSSDWGAAGSVDDNSLPEVFADGSNSSNGVVSTFAVEGGSWTCSASGQCITP